MIQFTCIVSFLDIRHFSKRSARCFHTIEIHLIWASGEYASEVIIFKVKTVVPPRHLQSDYDQFLLF
ncbi:hypothetical protein ANAPC5_01398 [Anaplasma phagocytophilum]|nr:hypothetical protein ANAPC5_01398 [Anaplasma phagocytophilum]